MTTGLQGDEELYQHRSIIVVRGRDKGRHKRFGEYPACWAQPRRESESSTCFWRRWHTTSHIDVGWQGQLLARHDDCARLSHPRHPFSRWPSAVLALLLVSCLGCYKDGVSVPQYTHNPSAPSHVGGRYTGPDWTLPHRSQKPRSWCDMHSRALGLAACLSDLSSAAYSAV